MNKCFWKFIYQRIQKIFNLFNKNSKYQRNSSWVVNSFDKTRLNMSRKMHFFHILRIILWSKSKYFKPHWKSGISFVFHILVSRNYLNRISKLFQHELSVHISEHCTAPYCSKKILFLFWLVHDHFVIDHLEKKLTF